MADRSHSYRRRDGEKRLWFSANDIETMMEKELQQRESLPSEDNPVVNIEGFIQSLEVRMDQYAELDATVLGLTEFYEDGPPKIFINRDLTGAIDDDHTPPGIRGRWRATMAHEACHVVMHRALFQVDQNQGQLFQNDDEGQVPAQRIMRCLKRNVLFRGGGTGDWREVQANMGMAALLMPRTLFLKLVHKMMTKRGLTAERVVVGSELGVSLTFEMATLFDVSKQAAAIRMETLGVLQPANQQWLVP